MTDIFFSLPGLFVSIPRRKSNAQWLGFGVTPFQISGEKESRMEGFRFKRSTIHRAVQNEQSLFKARTLHEDSRKVTISYRYKRVKKRSTVPLKALCANWHQIPKKNGKNCIDFRPPLYRTSVNTRYVFGMKLSDESPTHGTVSCRIHILY